MVDRSMITVNTGIYWRDQTVEHIREFLGWTNGLGTIDNPLGYRQLIAQLTLAEKLNISNWVEKTECIPSL